MHVCFPALSGVEPEGPVVLRGDVLHLLDPQRNLFAGAEPDVVPADAEELAELIHRQSDRQWALLHFRRVNPGGRSSQDKYYVPKNLIAWYP